MAYTLTRTSMALDPFTLEVLDSLAKKWRVPKAEVMRRAVRQMKELDDLKEQSPKPLQALDWLQNGGGMTVQEAESFRDELKAEREAKLYWCES
jgi:predicted transcriptional regulator